jgi:energy-coupling factor transporter ATP-binding protein EcfA2
MMVRTFPLVIGICGRAGAGKDTVARILTGALREHNGGRHRVVRRGLADPVKEVCRAVFGFSESQLYGPSAKRNEPDPRWDGLTPRSALQLCGTEFGRAFHPDTWIRKLLTDCNGYGARTIVFVPDVRFDNEAAAIAAKGGFVIEVRRPGEIDETIAAHASEAGVSAALIAHTVENDGTIEALKVKLGAELVPIVCERLDEHGRK